MTSGGTVVVGNFTLKAKAWKSSQTSSPTATAVYAVTGTATTPTVSGGSYHSLAVRSDGAVFAWGGNTSSELGDGTTTRRLLPVPTGGVTGVAAVVGGQGFSLARLLDGRVVGWGSNYLAQLGDGTSVHPRAWPVPDRRDHHGRGARRRHVPWSRAAGRWHRAGLGPEHQLSGGRWH